MFVRWLILIIPIGAIYFQYVYSERLVGGLQKSSSNKLKTEMVNLARQQLSSNPHLASKRIRVLDLYTQIVAGTNIWLTFIVGEKQNCTLTAFKPLPYTKKPIEVIYFACNNITSINDAAKYNY
ncbi:unnamed protein product [Rotaria sordida]|uniref:Uncharacterized protein n=1 Tax=Rotaria sordida TaxID=392033 RepID=A0A819E9P1_9BILA|nr:unnamed protein product [Rotaria sordida]